MKKLWTILLAGVLVCALAACGSGGDNPAEPTPTPTATPIPYADADFISAMKESLQARWDISEQKSNAEILAMDSIEYTTYIEGCIQAETEIISEYADKFYSDVKLQNLAKKYVECLNAQTDALDYYASDLLQYDEKWTEAYNERTKIIQTLVDEYGLSVDEKYQSILDELSTNAQVVVEKEEKESAIEEIAEQVNFKRVETEEDYGWPEYETVLENTSGEEISYYTLVVSLLDEDGVIIESAYCNGINNWKPGTKAKLTFMTDKEFSKVEWTAEYYTE